MPIIKSVIGHYDSINKKITRAILYYAPIAGLIIYITPESKPKLLVAFICFIGLIILIVKVGVKNHKPFICKECGESIKDTVERKGTINTDPEPIMYYCKKCDILWHVGNTLPPG